MRKALSKFKRNILNFKKLKAINTTLTSRIDCVNLSVSKSLLKGIKLYNNTDLIAELSWSELDTLLSLGTLFGMSAVYLACKKYSINYYW